MIKSLTCDCNNTLLEVMHIINENGMGVCFVTDEVDSLKGVVTDGDIRRAILNHKSLDSLIVSILNENFVCGHIDDSNDKLIEKINEKINEDIDINIIPIVDQHNQLVDYFRYSHQSHFPVAIPNLGGNEFKYLTDAFLSTWISSSGDYIDKFEDQFSSYSDCEYGISVANGTAALHVSLVALDIGEGDEVIIPDLTFAATINAVLHANATPVIVDIDLTSWCIDPKEIEKSITSKTKAIIPVHVYGQVCDMDNIMILAKKYNLKVIEDCAEAHGAMFKDKKVGSYGDIGCFSFYGNKVITTGEGGMCVTNSSKLNDKLRLFRDHGMSKSRRYFHEVVGFNYRMTNLQAAIGLAQLERISEIHKNRFSYENLYRKIMSNSKFEFQQDLENSKRIVWLVCILLIKNDNGEREKLIATLKDNGIEARPFFYLLSDMEIYKKYSHGLNSSAKKISSSGINLPTYESLMSLDQIELIIKRLFKEKND
jgi:perosamine synthetase